MKTSEVKILHCNSPQGFIIAFLLQAQHLHWNIQYIMKVVHNESWVLQNSKDFLLLCDIEEPSPPEICTKWTFIFSSPDPRRYKESIKNAPSFSYTMPTWSFTELKSLNGNIDLWIDNYDKVGGVPRLIFQDAVDLEDKLTDA
jgi:hypothetical protein